jgi:hypothetical protein
MTSLFEHYKNIARRITPMSSRPERRRLADAAFVPRLCRGQVEPAGRGAGDQPALSVGGKRPARHRRRFANGPADLRRAGPEAVRPGREPAGPAGAERRRVARLRAAQRQHLLSRQLHLPDREPRDERRRRRAARTGSTGCGSRANAPSPVASAYRREISPCQFDGLVLRQQGGIL